MSNRDFFIARWNVEAKAFVGVLRALPEGQGEYRPHPRSRSAAELAWLLALEARALVDFLERGEADWDETTPPAGLAGIADAYAAASDAVARRLGATSEAAWAAPVRLKVGGKVAFEQPLGEMMWFFLFDFIHHRGQLSSYIRPMGGRVPSIYGPSADDPGDM